MPRLLLALFTSLLAFSATTCAQTTPAAPATPTRQLTVEELFKKPAEEIARYSRDKGSVFVPLTFESDDQTLQVTTKQGRDTLAVYRYDLSQKKLDDVIAQHSRYCSGADISPVNPASKIKGAVFLYAGEDNARVPIAQINRMDRALKAAGNPARAFVVNPLEGHGYGKTENAVDLYNQMLKFLDEQIGK